jgi:hypothetical protein
MEYTNGGYCNSEAALFLFYGTARCMLIKPILCFDALKQESVRAILA